MKEATTIKLAKLKVQELDHLKQHPRETYEDVVERLIDFYMENAELEQEGSQRKERT